MKQKQKLSSQEQEQVAQTHTQQNVALEFTTPEELIRHDAQQTEVPPSVTKRLGESLTKQPKPARSLWRRLTGR